MKMVMATTNGNASWKISELYEKSFEIIKKNKVLWIFGMAAGLGGGSGFNNIPNLDDEDLETIFGKNEEASQIMPHVLGTATSQGGQVFDQLFSGIPTYLYVILGIEVLAIIIFSIIIAYISIAWSTAALIQSIQSALNGKGVSIRENSEKAFPSIKSLIWLSVLTTLILVGGIIVLSLPILIAVAINNIVLTVIMAILTVISVVPVILIFIMIGIWAPRIIIFEQKNAWLAFKSGFRMARKKFWASLGLGIVNNILATFVVAIPLIILVAIGIGIVSSISSGSPIILFLLPFATLLGLASIIGFLLLSGILTAFKASVWTMAYNKIRGKYEK